VVKINGWLIQDPTPLTEDIECIGKDLGRFLAKFVITTSKLSAESISSTVVELRLATSVW
jgi:hypothetical protein